MAEDKAPPHEIVIIRRGHGDDHEGHHGGVWKIAFADFMTALMAFFLVLWIVNSSSKATRSSIARYFNPIQLTDSTPARRGLQEARENDSDASGDKEHNSQADASNAGKASKPETVGKAAKSEADPHAARPPAPDPKPPEGAEHKAGPKPLPLSSGGSPGILRAPAHTEAALFRDPYAVLAEIAAGNEDAAQRQNAKPPLLASGGLQGLNADEAYRDPFEPVSPALEARPRVEPEPQPPPTPAASGKQTGSEPQAQAGAKHYASAVPAARAEPMPPNNDAETSPSGSLLASLAKALQADGAARNAPHVELKVTQEGTLISLTDSADFAMFAIGSSEPDARVVALMAKIGDVLKTNPGAIVVRGHTDGRVYRSATGDNWRLSASRAQMAFYMLVRGGLNEARFEKIEGHADHALKRPEAPSAADNRRIEILVRADQP